MRRGSNALLLFGAAGFTAIAMIALGGLVEKTIRHKSTTTVTIIMTTAIFGVLWCLIMVYRQKTS